MSDYDRGRQAPGSEPPLAFDGRRPARRSGPAPVTLILSLLLLVVVGGGVFYIYRGGVRGSGDAPRPVGAPVGDVRTAAPSQVQTPDPAAGLSIYKDDPNAASATPAFVPPPEQPTPRPAPANAATPAPAAPATTPAPVKEAAPQPAKPVPAKAAAVKPPAAKPYAPVKPTSIAKLLEADASPPAKSSPAVVQIGAFSSKDLADAGWNDAAGVAPGVMAGKGKRVTPLTKGDGSTLYRTSITGFASRDEAQALCAKLKAAGQSCFVR
ncbi:MAG: SPOR domain-containing protein [Caulobacteraceae bacterium]